jgi:iron-sulfur cluster repair protein YtfE (RIC family)
MRIDATRPITDLTSGLPGARQVKESHRIDYSFAGSCSIADAAYAEGLDPLLVIGRLRRLDSTESADSWSDRALKELTTYLVDEHHRFVHQDMAAIALQMAELCVPAAPPDLHILRRTFTTLSQVLLPHLHEEELYAFPAIGSLEDVWQSAELRRLHTLKAMIGGMMAEHRVIAEYLSVLRRTRLRLEEAGDPAPMSRRLLDSVARFEGRIHELLFLENCALYPRAAAMTDQLAEERRALVTA